MSRVAKASLLLFFFSLCAAAFVVAHRLEQRTPAPAPGVLFAVVNDQLAAFRAADFPAAYRHAASGVHQKFTPAQFERMVRRDYAGILKAQRVEFGSVKVEGGSAFVQVFFFGGNGFVRSFQYSLTAEGSSWKIESVQEIPVFHRPASLGGLHV